MVKPLVEFPRLHEGDNRCERCCNGEYEQAIKRGEVANRFLKDANSELTQPQINTQTFVRIASGMMKQFGGVEGLCQVWMGQIQQACERRPGTRGTLQSIESVVKLQHEAAKLEEHRQDVDQMNRTELQKEAMRLTAMLRLAESPAYKELTSGGEEVQPDG